MSKRLTVISLIIVLLATITYVYAEKATELYIPIGQSPGLSGKYLATGRIEQVNSRNQTITMLDASRTYTIKVTERTMYFLDRSKMQQSNLYGTWADCKKGMLVEVRFENDERGQPAEWIKLQIGP